MTSVFCLDGEQMLRGGLEGYSLKIRDDRGLNNIKKSCSIEIKEIGMVLQNKKFHDIMIE